MNIALGSASEQKKKYLSEVLSSLEITNFEITTHDVDSGITEQPLTSEETLQGSLNRAIEAFDKEKVKDFSIGIEVGYELNNDDSYEMFCWVTIFDGMNKYSCKSNSFLLPRFHQDKIKAGLYLGDFVRDFCVGDGVIKRSLGLAIRDRNFIIKNAILHVLLRFLNRDEY